MTEAQWKCGNCGRVLDDHQLRDASTGKWLVRPLCVEPGKIARGER